MPQTAQGTLVFLRKHELSSIVLLLTTDYGIPYNNTYEDTRLRSFFFHQNFRIILMKLFLNEYYHKDCFLYFYKYDCCVLLKMCNDFFGDFHLSVIRADVWSKWNQLSEVFMKSSYNPDTSILLESCYEHDTNLPISNVCGLW